MASKYEPQTICCTEVYDNTGALIERLDGFVTPRGRDYADSLPVTYRHVKTTTQVINFFKIEK